MHLSANGTLERLVARACTGLTDKCKRLLFTFFVLIPFPDGRTTMISLTSVEHHAGFSTTPEKCTECFTSCHHHLNDWCLFCT